MITITMKNRRYLELTVALGGGLILGGVAGFLAGRQRAQKRAEERFASEIASLQAYYRARTNAARKGSYPGDREAAVGGANEPGGTGSEGPGSGGAGRVGSGGTAGPVPYSRAYEPDDTGGPTPPSTFVPGAARYRTVDEAFRGGDPVGVVPDGEGDEDEPDEVEDDHEDREDGGDFDPGAQPGRRHPEPEVISSEEYRIDKPEYSKLQITWYVGDSILSDDRDIPIVNFAGVVGRNFSSKFGQKSDDDNIVFIRNHRLMSDFEIIRHHGTYAEVVQGRYGKTQ